MKTREFFGQCIGLGLTLANVHIGSKENRSYGNDDRGAGYVPVEVNVVCTAIGAHKVTEGDETGYTGYY